MIDNGPDELEVRLRRVLAVDAEQAPRPAQMLPRLAPVGGLSAKRAHRGRVARWAAVAASIAALGAGAAVTGLAGSSPGAFADWRSTPQKADAATVGAVGRACQQQSEATGLTVLAVDLRGDGAYAVLSDGKTWLDCVVTRRHSQPGSWADSPGWMEVGTAPAKPGSQPLTIASAKAPEGGPGRPHALKATWVSGWVGPTVTRVRIHTSQGQVDTTVTNGVFAAWWPGNDGDTAVVSAYDRSGALLARADELTCADGPRIRVVGEPSTGGCKPTG